MTGHKIRIWLMLAGQFLCFQLSTDAQELYVFTEPASNMPSRSISAKYTVKFLEGYHTRRLEQRHTPEIMFGLNRNWMVHVATSFSDMYSSNIRWESVRAYAKYRFFSNDDVHRHFRMAAFAEAAYSTNNLFYDELALEGDQSGVQGGVILTQLVNKLALSSTLSFLQVTREKAKPFPEAYPYQSFNYTASAGYLVFPLRYNDYRQTNLNIYAELLGQQTLDRRRYFVDLAPAVQLIFNSNSKLNIGYRFQLNGNMHRMAEKSWLISFERTFLNALSSRKK
jgi:hypothetical protein